MSRGAVAAWFGWFARHPVASVVAAALAVKATVLIQLGSHPLLQPHGELDTAYYVDVARQVAAGGPFAVPGPFVVSPLYVFFLAAVFKVSGGSLLAAKLAQALLGSAAVGLLHLTARQWFGERVAWVASVLAILTGLFAFSETLILQAALDPFLVALALFWVSRVEVDARPWPLAAAGLSLGLLSLNRPNALVFAVAAIVIVACATWRRAGGLAPAGRMRAAADRAGIVLVSTLLVLAPNALRNHAVSGEWTLISSHGGLNFLIGNDAEATGTYRLIPGITPSIAGQARDATRVAEAATGRRLTSGEVSAYFYRRAWDWMRGHPVDALWLAMRKGVYLLNRTDVPLNYSYAYYSRDESTLLRLLVVGPWLLVPLGLVGFFLPSMRSGRRGFSLWASFVPIYGLSVVAFFVSDRYRMPLLIPLCATSGATVVWAWDTCRARQFARLLWPAGALALLVTLTFWNWRLDDGRGGEQTRRAVWLIEEGRADEARQYVDAIAPTHSHPGVLRFRVAGALAAAGRFDEAVFDYRAALAIDGDRPAIRLELGDVLRHAGRPAEAVPHLEAAVRASYQIERAAPALIAALRATGEESRAVEVLSSLPGSPADWPADVALELGEAALELRAPQVAEPWLRAAAAGLSAPSRPSMPGFSGSPASPESTGAGDRSARSSEAHEKLGVALVMLRRAGEAIAPLETACRLAPSGSSAHLNLAVAYAEVGRTGEALVEAQEAVRLDPADPQAAGLLIALEGRRLEPERRPLVGKSPVR